MPEAVDIKTFGVKQRLNAGNDFSAVLPTTTPVISTSKQFSYPADDQGGKIDFPGRNFPIALRQLAVKLGGQTAWALRYFDGEDNFLIEDGTTESTFVYRGELILLPGQYAWFETTGASGAMLMNAIWGDVELQ